VWGVWVCARASSPFGAGARSGVASSGRSRCGDVEVDVADGVSDTGGELARLVTTCAGVSRLSGGFSGEPQCRQKTSVSGVSALHVTHFMRVPPGADGSCDRDGRSWHTGGVRGCLQWLAVQHLCEVGEPFLRGGATSRRPDPHQGEPRSEGLYRRPCQLPCSPTTQLRPQNRYAYFRASVSSADRQASASGPTACSRSRHIASSRLTSSSSINGRILVRTRSITV
jgi:hypothetical protein